MTYRIREELRSSMATLRSVSKFAYLSSRVASEIFLINQTLTFFDGQILVHARVGNLVNYTTRPMNFYKIYLRSFFETKMQPEIILRKIASAASHLIHLRQIPGDNFRSEERRVGKECR